MPLLSRNRSRDPNQDRSNQDRSNQDRSNQDRSNQDRSSQNRLSQERSSQERSSQDRSNQDRSLLRPSRAALFESALHEPLAAGREFGRASGQRAAFLKPAPTRLRLRLAASLAQPPGAGLRGRLELLGRMHRGARGRCGAPRARGTGRAQESYRHRIPLGLVMLEQGWITSSQLRQALEAQKVAGAGRLGHWLVRRQGVSEQLVVRALSLQWSCPVLPLEFHDAEALTALVPRLFVDAFGALPLRVAAGKLLYLGFEDRLDPVVALAVER